MKLLEYLNKVIIPKGTYYVMHDERNHGAPATYYCFKQNTTFRKKNFQNAHTHTSAWKTKTPYLELEVYSPPKPFDMQNAYFETVLIDYELEKLPYIAV